jgi:hypothetical protein
MKLREIVSYLEIDRRKFTEYALNADNPKGMNKALLFQRHLGYTRDNYESLLVQIMAQALEAEAIFQFSDLHGDRYQIDLNITGIEPKQQKIVRTGWLIHPNSNTAKLVTLYIKKQ